VEAVLLALGKIKKLVAIDCFIKSIPRKNFLIFLGVLIFVYFCYTLCMEIKDVENLAELARLELSEEEKKSLLHDMGGILEYVKVIESVEIDDVNPKYDVYNAWRQDIPRGLGDEFSQKEIIAQFPHSQNGFLKVKKII
jgi:aspartyl-tRNA(Asn)/glutamyl-tRNA(Gln) amidotransferase subunit C